MSGPATKTVMEIGAIEFSGDIVMPEWYDKIRREKGGQPGKVHAGAILLLARIIYWYRPTVVINEKTNRVTGYEKKFAGDKLQMSYRQIEAHFGFTHDEAISAVSTLVRLGLITVELRHPVIGGVKYGNVMFIEPVPTAIYSLCHTPSPDKIGEGLTQQNRRPSPRKIGDPHPAHKVTNTETTTEITTKSDVAEAATSGSASAPESTEDPQVGTKRSPKEKKLPDPAMRFDGTEGGKLIASLLEETYAGMTPPRKAPEYYANPKQRDAYLQIYRYLNGNLKELANKGLARGRISRENLLAWLQNCVEQEQKRQPGANTPTLEKLGYA